MLEIVDFHHAPRVLSPPDFFTVHLHHSIAAYDSEGNASLDRKTTVMGRDECARSQAKQRDDVKLTFNLLRALLSSSSSTSGNS